MRLSESFVGHLGGFISFPSPCESLSSLLQTPRGTKEKEINHHLEFTPPRRMAIERGGMFGYGWNYGVDIDVSCLVARNLVDIPAWLRDGVRHYSA